MRGALWKEPIAVYEAVVRLRTSGYGVFRAGLDWHKILSRGRPQRANLVDSEELRRLARVDSLGVRPPVRLKRGSDDR
jgi:hypothetical protein